MSPLRLAIFLALVSSPSFSQIPSTVTVTVSANPNATPIQAVFSVTVAAPPDRSFEEVVRTVSTLGITASNLAYMNSSSAPLTLSWTFQFPTPLAKAKETTAALTALQKNLAQTRSPLTISFSLSSTLSSAPSTAACDLATLVASARQQATQLTAPARLSPGAILSVAGSISQSLPGCVLTVAFSLRNTAPAGQGTISVAATRTLPTTADQAVIVLTVDSALSLGLDEVTAALAASGLQGATFTGARTPITDVFLNGQPTPMFEWSFSLTAPLAKLNDTFKQLTAAQQTISKANSGITMQFYFSTLQPSAPPPCIVADLVADASTMAQRIAAAAGASSGAILNISDSVTPPPYVPLVAAALGANRLGGFIYDPYPLGLNYPSAPAQCAMTVTFQMQ